MPLSRLEHSQEEQELSALMRKAQRGDRASYSILLEKVQGLLKPYVANSLRKMKRDAGASVVDDVVQDALLGIHSKRDTYDPDQFFLPWMYAITRYKVIDYYRFRKAHELTVSLDENDDWEKSQEEMGSARDVETLLATLPEKQKNLLSMVKISGLSIHEAALKTGFTPSDVKVSIHRAIETLKDRVKHGKK